MGRIPRANLVGRPFGLLTVVADAGNNRHSQSVWRCSCACGGPDVLVCISHLKDGHTRSCGCLRKEVSRATHSTNIADGSFRCSSCKRRKLLKFKVEGAGNYRCKPCNRKYNKLRYKENPSPILAAARKWRADNPELVKVQLLVRKRAQPELYLWRLAKCRAQRKGLVFTLKVADIVIPRVCPVLGLVLLPVSSGAGMPLPNSPTLDRRDSRRGYTPDNITVISWRANSLKKDGSLLEIKQIAEWMQTQEGA